MKLTFAAIGPGETPPAIYEGGAIILVMAKVC